MGGKSSSSNSSQVTNQYDQRAITTIDDRDTAYSYTDASDRSLNYAFTDSSNRSTTDNSIALGIHDDRDLYQLDSSNRSSSNVLTDSSNRSVSTVNNTGTDPGLVRLAELQAGLAGAVAEQQTDAVKSIAAFGSDSIARMGESVTNLYAVAGNNSSKAWEHTIDASASVLDRLFTGAEANSAAASQVANAAIASYTPSENKSTDAMKWVAIAAVVIGGAAFLFRR